MKFLTLIRHAKSSHDNPALNDFDRVLNHRGEEDAPRMGRHLRKKFEFTPDRIISSPAVRALTTARLIAGQIGYEPAQIEEEPAIYEARMEAIAAVIQRVPDTVRHLCMVGHNPGMENLSTWLAGRPVMDSFVTCGVAMFEVGIETWDSLHEGCATLKEFIIPREL